MSKVPSLSYVRIVHALQRIGFVVVRQRGSHIRLQRHLLTGETVKITVPVHTPVLRSTLAHILKQGRIMLEEFLQAL